ncbi:MAG: PKD domain-containing protein [Candidatus Gracilibacteria bacterium]|nr:PKD domain-containing protein [Candidatus Gracilibacteria bacterium]MDQ7022747.1 PKD domain-containing protein [Candidatus Gracilibacteria bacterium]
MFDPSKLNLDLDENNKVSKVKTSEEIKAELEKVEKVFDNRDFLKQEEKDKQEKYKQEKYKQEEKDILGDIEQKFIEKDLEQAKEKKEENKNEKIEEKKEQKEVVGDISRNIEMNKMFKKAEDKIKEKTSTLEMIDINIQSLQDILDLMIKNGSDIFVFESRDNDIKVIFRESKVEKDIKYIKFPIYNQILLKVKALSKMKVEEIKIGQDGKGEIQIKDSKYAIVSKTIPSVFGEKLFFKMKKLEKKVIPKSQQKTSLSTLFGFMAAIAIVALLIGGAFIGFIVMNAKTLEDVKFFYNLGINLNDINAFIGKSVNIIFSILLFIETVFLAMFGFKALLTKKIYKKKKIAYSIFTIIILLFTFTTGSAWMYINKKINSLPNWQVMAKGDVQIFDNSKLISGNFSEAETIMDDTSNLIGPVTLKFDLSSFEYRERKKGFNINRYEWSFNGEKEKSKKTSSIIKTFNNIGTYSVVVDVFGTNAKGEEEKKTIENIKSVEISNIVKITEKVDKLGFKTVSFNASDLKDLGEIEWYFIEKGQEGKLEVNHTGYDFYPKKKIIEDTMVGIFIKREGKKSIKLDKIFIIKKEEKSQIKGEIKFEQDLVDDFKYKFYVENPDNAFGNGFVETFTWKIESNIKKLEAGLEDVEGSSKYEHTFKTYGKQNIEVELRDTSGKIKILVAEINIPKRLKIKSKYRLKIFNNGKLLEDVRYEEKNREYFVNELNVPTKIKLDARLIRSDDILYKLDSVSWDINDDGTIDKTGKTLDLDIDVEGNQTVIINYKFIHRRIKDDIINMKERIYIESIKKDAILKLKITPKERYVPTFVRFDASLTQIKGKNIEKFVYNYGDGTPLDERDAINPAHKYNLAGEYDIKLTVITTDGGKYHLTKKLVLKPKPQKASISISMKNTLPNQDIDFSSEGSQGQITGYFWDFGDGEVSTDANPGHSFEEPGKYSVKLKLTFSNNNFLEDEVEIEVRDYE